jgi:hypothetical protein
LLESTFAARFDKKIVGFQNLPERPSEQTAERRHGKAPQMAEHFCSGPGSLAQKGRVTHLHGRCLTRRTGLGRLQKAYDTARDMRLKHVTLHVIEKNVAIKRLYNREDDEELVQLPLFLLWIFTFQLPLFLLCIFTCKAAWFQRKPLTSLLPFFWRSFATQLRGIIRLPWIHR